MKFNCGFSCIGVYGRCVLTGYPVIRLLRPKKRSEEPFFLEIFIIICQISSILRQHSSGIDTKPCSIIFVLHVVGFDCYGWCLSNSER
jgi:hypothetical protein